MILVALSIYGCSAADRLAVAPTPVLASITIDTSALVLERGARLPITATVRDRSGAKVAVPVVWRSTNEQIATFDLGGVLVARDTGSTTITAASAGVVSTAVAVRVVWLGPAKLARGPWSRPLALMPGASLHDSVRVLVTNIAGAVVVGAKVSFVVTTGGGSVSPRVAETGTNGIAATQWTLGPDVGPNALSASVVHEDGSPDPLVAQNALSFSITSFRALAVVSGESQTQQILSSLTAPPVVRLTDSLGNPRRGIPVSFTAQHGGRVSAPLVSTGADGLASPGIWSLGDTPGEQLLTASVEDAAVTFHARATGTPVHYNPASLTAGAFSTCALDVGGAPSCWGQSPQNGIGDTSITASPTRVKASLSATSIVAGATHTCALTARGVEWCWGNNVTLDTLGHRGTSSVPLAIVADQPWTALAVGASHDCAIASDQSAWCWGANGAGQLGTRDTVHRERAAAVAGSFKFSYIAAGNAHTCALSLDGSAFCWGSNQFGQLGDGTTQSRTTPTAVNGRGAALTFQSISAGDAFTCGLTTTGRIYCWGLLVGATQPTPVTFPDAPTAVALSVGGEHACALAADGSARCWGSNSLGQLGDSTLIARTAPTVVAGGFRFSQITAGHSHTCGKTIDGDVVCWGSNASGELGDRGASLRTVPRYIVLGVNP